MDLQKPADEKAHADPLRGYKPNGICDSPVHTRIASALIQKREPESHTKAKAAAALGRGPLLSITSESPGV